jgi:hypothetical protein
MNYDKSPGDDVESGKRITVRKANTCQGINVSTFHSIKSLANCASSSNSTVFIVVCLLLLLFSTKRKKKIIITLPQNAFKTLLKGELEGSWSQGTVISNVVLSANQTQ